MIQATGFLWGRINNHDPEHYCGDNRLCCICSIFGIAFQVTGQPPHQDAPLQFKIITFFYGLFFSVAAGYVVQLIATQTKLTLNYILTALMFLLAATSIVFSKGSSHWTQLFAMLIFAPASIIGGNFKLRRSKIGR